MSGKPADATTAQAKDSTSSTPKSILKKRESDGVDKSSPANSSGKGGRKLSFGLAGNARPLPFTLTVEFASVKTPELDAAHRKMGLEPNRLGFAARLGSMPEMKTLAIDELMADAPVLGKGTDKPTNRKLEDDFRSASSTGGAECAAAEDGKGGNHPPPAQQVEGEVDMVDEAALPGVGGGEKTEKKKAPKKSKAKGREKQ